MIHIALDITLIMMTAYISISDIKFHRIPNTSLLILTITLLYSTHTISMTSTLIILCSIWLVGLLAKMGMGDLKLLTILLILHGQILINPIFWIFFAAIALLSIIFHILARGTMRGEIPLAPAILFPFTGIYLSF
jgi:Flp pilus assembly protein protease CpaA